MSASPLLARADLLRALVVAGDDDDRQRRYAGLLCFERRPVLAPVTQVIAPVGWHSAQFGTASVANAVEAKAQVPLRAPLFAITACRRLELPSERSEAEPPQPLTPAQCAPRRSDGKAAPFVPLVRRARLWPALRRSAVEERNGGLDMPRLLRELAGVRPLRRLPLCRQSLWGGELLVVWDRAAQLQPYQEDFQAIVADLLRQRGSAGFTLWLVDGSPQQVRQRWPEKPGHTGAGSAPVSEAIVMPAPGTRVLMLSDVGAFTTQAAARTWAGFARQLAQHGAQPVVWAPLAPRQVDVELTRWADVFCLQPVGGLRRQRGRLASDEQRRIEAARLAALREQLLARMAFCVRVEPALLRALRGVTPETAAEPALEALVWAHQPVVGDSHVSRAVAADYVATYRQAFAALPADEQFAALERALHVHAWRGRATEAAEVSIWQAHARPEARQACAALADEAQGWFAAMRQRATQGSGADSQLQHYTLDLLARNGSDQRWVAANSEWLAPVWLASGAHESPSGLHDEHLAQALAATDLSEVDCQLGVSDEGLMLWGSERPAGPCRSRLGSPFLRLKRLQVSDTDGKSTRLLDPATGAQRIATVDCFAGPARGVTLVAGHHRYLVSRIERPEWAEEIGRDVFGLYADVLLPVDQGEIPDTWPAIRFRLRYIEAGHFLMGSPVSEAKRDEREGPQHEVTLSQGFWLADSACTQALWEAVVGDNPSAFREGNGGGAQHPVEQVSWDDVQHFLRQLQDRLPGAVAGLPSEAEWEYACRAGTRTPFAFGDNISSEEVNYNGDFPYDTGSRGSNGGFGRGTVPVGSLPANAWGLYEMHGNVWEWCADGWRDYAERDETDPVGTLESRARVLRGGSWLEHATDARCAYRNRYAPGYRLLVSGFRLVLRSSSAAEATEWPAPQDGPGQVAGRGVPAPGTGAVFAAARSRLIEPMAAQFQVDSQPSRTPSQWPIPKAKRSKR